MRLLDSFPTNKKGSLEYRAGHVLPFGATLMGDAVNFSVYSKEATGCTLVLFRYGQEKPWIEIPFPEEFRIGNVYTMLVYGINIETTEYGYRFDGVNEPGRGILYDKSKIMLDPYAKSIRGHSVWGRMKKNSHVDQHRGMIVREDYMWEGDKPMEIEAGKLIIYETHVRSFTISPSSGVKYKGTFAGIVEKIPYFRELGINCIELMPLFEYDEFENYREIDGRKLYNYWGYSTVGFFAPKAGYAASAPVGMEVDELKNMIKKLHQNGIAVVLDVVFNHTAEGNEDGPFISFKGIDNRTYYLLTPDGHYYNFSGCGNTMNCNNPVVRNMVKDCLRYWVSEYHIDGFRFDLASIMSRGSDGSPMLHPPILDSISNDAVLGKTLLIAEAWDAGGLYQIGRFKSFGSFAEWNGKYRDCLRRFIKGGAECAPELFNRIRGSTDIYGDSSPASSINFVTCHDGFTLYDLVSYNEKHNQANGEDNRDGCDDNISWNCGVEGDTDDPEVLNLRFRQMKNMMTILLTSRGIPMFLSGDEFANTQFGNNNAYCQDNEISWLDWSLLDKNMDLFEYVKALIDFRKKHPVISANTFDFGENGTGYPEVSLHGTNAWDIDENAPGLAFAYMFAEDGAKYGLKKDSFIYIAVNAHWEGHTFGLPVVPKGFYWKLKLESGESGYEGGSKIFLQARSTAVLVAEK